MEQPKFEDESKNPAEQLKLQIQQALNEAKEKAISLDEAKDIFKKIDDLKSAGGDNHKAIRDFERRLEQGSVWVKTISAFKILMEEVIGNKELLSEMLGHENAHANMAEIVGATHDGYLLKIFKDGDNFAYLPTTLFSHPSEWLTNEKLSDVIRVYNAPNEYGHQTSEGDENRIEQLKRYSSNN